VSRVATHARVAAMHLDAVALPELDLGQFADVLLGFLQQIQQRGDRLPMDLRGLQQLAAFVGDAVDAAVLLVAIRIAQMMLHVADERLVPVREIERAVGPRR
jgi:hypothetical protein